MNNKFSIFISCRFTMHYLHWFDRWQPPLPGKPGINKARLSYYSKNYLGSIDIVAGIRFCETCNSDFFFHLISFLHLLKIHIKFRTLILLNRKPGGVTVSFFNNLEIAI